MSCSSKSQSRRGASAFTFVEILASLLFMAIVIPAIVTALTISNRAAVVAERSTVAVQLGENRLNEIIVERNWSGGESRGEFGPEWPGYRWELTQGSWDEDNMTELSLDVYFPVQGREQSFRLTTLVDSSTQ